MIKNEFYFEFSDEKTINSYVRRINDEISSKEIGYYHLANVDGDLLNEIYSLQNDDFEKIVLIGVGGSSLGVKAIHEMLGGNFVNQKELVFLDNLDPFLIEKSLSNLDYKKTKFIISSKSGTTIETISIFKIILLKYDFKDFSNFIFITSPNSPLEKFAESKNAKIFNLPQNVGGRFSVLSAIGLVPLGLSNIDIKSLLEGAKACYKLYIENNNNEIFQKAYHYAIHPNAKINVLFSYSSRLKSFNDWYVQLWAESLGKKRGFKRIGLTPIGLIGSKDQHSFLQLIMEGTKDKTVTFIKILEQNKNIKIPNISLEFLENTDFTNSFEVEKILNSQAEATKIALKSENLSIDVLEIDKLDAWHAGFLIYYYELLTSTTGIMLGINTYDQPGVELGKRILKELINKNY